MPDPKGADAGQVSLCGKTDDDTGTEGQVGHHGNARTGAAVTVSANVAVVNGPEDDVADWHALDWRAAEDDVQRLRQRIFTASKAGDF